MVQFITDQEVIIHAAGQEMYSRNCRFNGKKIPEIIYEYGRCSISHEGELDERFQLVDGEYFFQASPAKDLYKFGYRFVRGLIVAVIIAPENRNELLKTDFLVDMFGVKHSASSLWGKQDWLMGKIKKRFRIS